MSESQEIRAAIRREFQRREQQQKSRSALEVLQSQIEELTHLVQQLTDAGSNNPPGDSGHNPAVQTESESVLQVDTTPEAEAEAETDSDSTQPSLSILERLRAPGRAAKEKRQQKRQKPPPPATNQ